MESDDEKNMEECRGQLEMIQCQVASIQESLHSREVSADLERGSSILELDSASVILPFNFAG